MSFERLKDVLEANGFQVSAFATGEAAAAYLNEVIDHTTVGMGGSMTLAELVLDTGRPIGEEWIVDGTQYISSTPYGLSATGYDGMPGQGAKFMLYAPGATQKDTGADKDFYWWIHQGPLVDIPKWALHNLTTDYGFLAR